MSIFVSLEALFSAPNAALSVWWKAKGGRLCCC